MSFSFRSVLAVEPGAWQILLALCFPTGVDSGPYFIGFYCSCYINPIKCVVKKMFGVAIMKCFFAFASTV